MATTLCSHNSALFNVRSKLKAKIGGGVGWSMLCLQRPTPYIPSFSVDSLLVDSPPVDSPSLNSPPVCSLTQEINGWFVAILKYMYSQVDASQNSVLL